MRHESSWYKGNLHMHSLWSDGDDFPELIAGRFKEAGYHFIAFTEHDRFQEGEPPPLGERQRRALGREESAGPVSVDLKSLCEYRDALEEPGRFLILNGEEVRVNYSDRPHWLNVINAPQPIGPIDFDGSSAEAIQHVINKVKGFASAAMVSFNHPNYEWNATAEDLAAAEALRFFEIHTALDCTRCYGDEKRAGAERIWDIALALRLLRHGKRPIFGLATDDCHFYRSADGGPCRAWVMVRAPELTPDALVCSMSNGDFYSSTGVSLTRLEAGPSGIHLKVEEAADVSYTTHFIGTRKAADMTALPILDENGKPIHTTKKYTSDVGAILKEVHGTEATYNFAGDEAYVRALVTSDCPHPCPTIPGDVMKAWTQPVCP